MKEPNLPLLDSRNKKKSKLSATPTKNNKIPAQAVITLVAAKNIFDVDNIDLKKPFTRFIKVDPQAYILSEYESTNNSKKVNGARKVITEVNHYYKQIMGWKWNEDVPSRDQILNSAIRIICAGTPNTRVLTFIMNIQLSEKSALVSICNVNDVADGNDVRYLFVI